MLFSLAVNDFSTLRVLLGDALFESIAFNDQSRAFVRQRLPLGTRQFIWYLGDRRRGFKRREGADSESDREQA